MNIKYLTPDTVSAALELKANHGSQAVWFAGGSKLNAAPTRSDAGVFCRNRQTGFGLYQTRW